MERIFLVLVVIFGLIVLSEVNSKETFSFMTVYGEIHSFQFNTSSPSECIFIDTTNVIACMDNLSYPDISSVWKSSGYELEYVSVNCLLQRRVQRQSNMCVCKDKPSNSYFMCHIGTLYQGLFNTTRNLQVLDLSNNRISNVRPRAFDGLPHVKYLSLQNTIFTNLHYGVFCDMVNLEFLDLSYNEFDVFPSHSFKCVSNTSNVKAIDISHSKIREIPKDSLDPLTSLTSLDLGSNLIGELHETSFEGGVELKDLNVSHNYLKFLIKDNDLCILLPKLRSLYLSKNEFDVFDFQELNSCQDLELLDLSRNMITSVSGSLSNLTSLKLLNISFNQLKTFHFDLKGLSGLESLDISYNQLHRLAEDKVSGLDSLTELYINNNNLNGSDNFQEFFKIFPLLKVLDMQHNQLKSIPENSFSELKKLSSLYLNHNAITLLDNNSFVGLEKLMGLHLQNNALVSLPSSVFRPLVSLEYLSLANNHIVSLIVKFWPSTLHFLDLCDNQLVSLPENIHQTNINTLNISTNHLTAFNIKGEILNNLETLDLSQNQIHNFNNTMFLGLPKLVHLNLEKNEMAMTMSINSFRGTSKLKTLNLAHNGIVTINQLFSQDTLNNLETLNVSFNPIDGIEQLAVDIVQAHIIEIDMSNCNISKLNTDTFAKLTRLRKVHLDDNNIEIFEPFNAEKGTSFNFSGNPVICSCHIVWIKDPYVEVDGKQIDSRKYIVPKCRAYTLDGMYSPWQLQRSQFLCLEAENCSTDCKCYKRDKDGYIVSTVCRNNLQAVPEVIPQSAITIFLDGNNFTRNNLKTLSNLKNMSTVEIYLNKSSITSIDPLVFAGFKKLEIISLAENSLTIISALLFANHTNLKQIYLQGNLLTTIEAGAFVGLPNLEELDISKNKFRVLSNETASELSSLPSSKYFFLADNRWICTCQNIYFKDFIDKVKFKIRDRRDLVCNGQEMLYVPKSSFTCVEFDKLHEGGLGKTVIIIVGCVLALLIVLGAFLYFRREVFSVVYSTTGLHIPRRCHIAGKTFDVFVGYDPGDQHASEYVQKKLLPKLRAHHYNYQSSKDVIQDIDVTRKTIEDSKCSLFVINSNFATNPFLVKVFHIASDLTKLELHKVVLVIHGDIDILTLEPEVMKRMHRGDYVTARSRLWWQRLMYELPVAKRLHPHENDDESETDTIIFSAIADEGFYNSMSES